jgi:carboxypeptidase family protein
MKAREAAVAAVLLLSLGCGPRGPILGTATKPPGVGGTIAGIVKTEDGTTALSARKVTAINTDTGARFEASTASNGGYTLKVPKGTYKLEVELRPGEVLAQQPGATDINVGDLDARRDFVVTVTARR